MPLPAGTEVNHLNLALGSLFSPGRVSNADYTSFASDGSTVADVPAAGGSIFNSLGLNLTVSIIGNKFLFLADSSPVGPIGAWEGLQQSIAGLLGAPAWDWNGKAGPPPPAVPPLSLWSQPVVPADFFDDGGASAGAGAAGDLSAWLGDLASALDISI